MNKAMTGILYPENRRDQSALETSGRAPVRSYNYHKDDKPEYKQPTLSRFKLVINWRDESRNSLWWPFHDLREGEGGQWYTNESESYKRAFQIMQHPQDYIRDPWKSFMLFMTSSQSAKWPESNYNVLIHIETRYKRIKCAQIGFKREGLHEFVDLNRVKVFPRGQWPSKPRRS